MTDENRNGTIVGELSGLSEAELAAVQELLERTAEEAAVDDDDQSSSCWGGRLTLTYKPSMTRRRNTVPDCRVALPITETRPPKIADRIFANAMISLSSEHRALWRQAERELKNTPDGRATSQLRNRRFSMPNVPLNVEAEKKSGKKVIPLIPSGIVSSLGLDDLEESVNTNKHHSDTARRCSIVSTTSGWSTGRQHQQQQQQQQYGSGSTALDNSLGFNSSNSVSAANDDDSC